MSENLEGNALSELQDFVLNASHQETKLSDLNRKLQAFNRELLIPEDRVSEAAKAGIWLCLFYVFQKDRYKADRSMWKQFSELLDHLIRSILPWPGSEMLVELAMQIDPYRQGPFQHPPAVLNAGIAAYEELDGSEFIDAFEGFAMTGGDLNYLTIKKSLES